MSFAYGPLQYNKSSLNATIGPLICSGLKDKDESFLHPRLKLKLDQVEKHLETLNSEIDDSKQTDEMIGNEFNSIKQTLLVSTILKIHSIVSIFHKSQNHRNCLRHSPI